MIPAARIAAAIEILDGVLGGQNAEQTLTTWGRKNRYAGSGDRAAIRDHVFQALRCERSYAWLGGARTGRGLMIGTLRAQDVDVASVFSGDGYAPAIIQPGEVLQISLQDAPKGVQMDMPDWLMPELMRSLGDHMAENCAILRNRAPIFLRANSAKATREDAIATLAEDAINCVAHDLSPTAILVQTNPRRVQTSKAYATGIVELQDAASQAIVDMLPESSRYLDYCAGGGGKALALAARPEASVFAHDVDPMRMKDIGPRARRAGVHIELVPPENIPEVAPFDLVLCDAPCSGSGSWRRAPQAKWVLTQNRLDELRTVQAEVLDTACQYVRPGGFLAYSTCSLLTCENADQVSNFVIKNPDWTLVDSQIFTPMDGADGFFVGVLKAPD